MTRSRSRRRASRRSRDLSAQQQDYPGPYEQLIDSLQDRYPNLIFLRNYLQSQRASRHDYLEAGRAAVLEFREDDSSHNDLRASTIRLDSSAQLRRYLSEPRTCARRLFLLEDVAGNYMEALGASLIINPQFFAAHCRMTRWEHDLEKSGGMPLQSTLDSDREFILRYHELILTDKNIAPRRSRGNIFYTDSNVRRQFQWHEEESRDPKLVSTVQRAVSFWSSTRRDIDADSGWDAVLLTDPPIGKFALKTHRLSQDDPERIPLESSGNSGPFRSSLYQGGYIDFIPWPSDFRSYEMLIRTLEGPPRSSMFDDCIWYFTVSGWLSNFSLASPMESSIFAKKIVLANWMLLLEYVQRSSREKEQTKQADYKITQATLELWQKRWLIYREQVETNMLWLGLRTPRGWPQHAATRIHEFRRPLQEQAAEDWTYILTRLSFFSERAAQLVASQTNSFMADTLDQTLIMAKESEEDNRNISRLTKLGAVFLPLSFAAGLLAMPTPFSALSDQFWIYWAISVPLIVVLFIAAYFPITDQAMKFLGFREEPRASSGMSYESLLSEIKRLENPKSHRQPASTITDRVVGDPRSRRRTFFPTYHRSRPGSPVNDSPRRSAFSPHREDYDV